MSEKIEFNPLEFGASPFACKSCKKFVPLGMSVKDVIKHTEKCSYNSGYAKDLGDVNG